jgi:hypothetical protein
MNENNSVHGDEVSYPPMSLQDVIDVLSITIKKDDLNKAITFLCFLLAYTEDSQFNISFNAPSSAGKSYIPQEVAKLFPPTDVKELAYCSPTAFFHDHDEGCYDRDTKTHTLDLSQKILIFLDQPHTILLQHLRPMLSHDRKELQIKITDKGKNAGNRTKNIVLIGYPAVVFCTAGLSIDEQEMTRFILLSPEVSQQKIKESIAQRVRREADNGGYRKELNESNERHLLMDRIKAIRDAHIIDIKVPFEERIQSYFCRGGRKLKLRHSRDVSRFVSIVKGLALLNLWYREKCGNTIVAGSDDLDMAIELWGQISEPQERNLPPYLYNFYFDVVLPAFIRKGSGLTRQEIIHMNHEVYERPLLEYQLRRQILPMLESAGLITQEPLPRDQRVLLIKPLVVPPQDNNGDTR